MEKSLVIVESPAKAKTITKFLGKDFKVLACKGHVRALPSKQGSVEIGEDVVPKYDIIADSKKFLSEISKSLKDCSTVYLATDPDREGEAIAWHLVSALKLDKPARGKAAQHAVIMPPSKINAGKGGQGEVERPREQLGMRGAKP